MEIQKREFSDSYETEEHRKIEREVIDQAIRKTNLIAYKLPKRDVLDFILVRDEFATCFAEVSSRRIAFHSIQEFYLPLKKYEVIKTHHESVGLPTALIVRFSDVEVRSWLPLPKTEKLEVIFWGDERDDKKHDCEPMVCIPVSHFERI